MTERGNFDSKLGIVLATAGSAVGLGNIWRFPYMTGQNGGAAFLLMYVACILLLGVPGMISEFIVGRNAQTNAASAYDKLSKGRPWKLVGHLGILTSTIILGFYAVVAGWCLQYLFASISGQVQGDAQYVQQYFVDFSSSAWKPVVCGLLFILITHLIVVRGVQHGIEKASKLLMPILLILLIVLVVASCMLPGAVEGIKFLLKPDFSKLSSDVMLEALGQAFFSLSLGTACLCTYASYFSRDTNLLNSAGQIALLDSLIALLAGLLIFPAAAAVGISADSGPSLIFITLLLVFAALTSTISMHEIGTAFFTEEFHMPRKYAAWVLTIVASVLCLLCSWSVGAFDIKVLGLSLMDFCDQLTANFMLPLGGMLACLYVGWYIPRQVVHDEFTNYGQLNQNFYRIYLFAVRYVCPVCIMLVFLHQLGIL